MSGENKTAAESSADATTNESDVQAFGTPITVGGDGGKAEAATATTGTPITVGGDGSPQQQ